MKHTLFVALTALVIMCTPPLLTSCKNVDESGSATFVIDTSALARDVETHTSTYAVDVIYSYGSTTKTVSKNITVYSSYDVGAQSSTMTAESITVDDLPYGTDVTFEVELYSYDPQAKQNNLSYVTKTPVTVTVTKDTPVEIALKTPTRITFRSSPLLGEASIGSTTGALILTVQDTNGRTDTRQYTASTNDTSAFLNISNFLYTKFDASAVEKITLTYVASNGKTYHGSTASKDDFSADTAKELAVSSTIRLN